MSLSLVQRKEIRDTGAKAKELLDRLKEETGIEFEFIVDFAGLLAKFNPSALSSYGDRIGTVFNDWYLNPIVDGLISFCKDPLCKESVREMCTKKQITIDILPDKDYEKDTKCNNYCRMRVIDGALVAQIKSSNLCSNVSYVSEDLNTTFAGNSALSLASRRNIAQFDTKRDEHLATMSQALGKTCVFEVDWPTLTKALEERGYAERHGDAMAWYLDGLVYYFKKVCDDEMGKEAMQEKFTGSEAVIRFVLDDKVTTYVVTRFENGALCIKVPSKNLCSNCSNTGEDLEAQL